MKKRIIISLIITCSICSILTGCKITKNKEITEEEVISTLENQEEKELEMVEKLLATESEKKSLSNKIIENKENNIYSENLTGKYTIVNKNNTNSCEIYIENVEKNLSTAGDYGSLWLYSNIENNNCGIYYSFIDEENKDYLLKNIPIVFSNEKIEETTYEKITYVNSNLFLKETYELTSIDKNKIPYYGYAFVYDVNENDKLLCVVFNTNPVERIYTEKVFEFVSNINF